MSNLRNDIQYHGHPGKYHKVTKRTGGLVCFTSSLSSSTPIGAGYGAGAVLISGSQTQFDQHAHLKLTNGGTVLLRDLAAATDDFFELSVAEVSGSVSGNSVTPGAAPNKGIEFIQTGVVYVFHRNTRVS